MLCMCVFAWMCFIVFFFFFSSRRRHTRSKRDWSSGVLFRSTLQHIYVRSASGGQVPLSTFTQTTETTAPLVIGHQGQFPSVTLSFNLAPGVSLGEAVRALESATQQIGLPASIRGSFQGTAQAFQASLTNEPLLILAALVTVYIVLGVLYESYIH